MHDHTPDGESEFGEPESAESERGAPVIETQEDLLESAPPLEDAGKTADAELHVETEAFIPYAVAEKTGPHAADPGLNAESALGASAAPVEAGTGTHVSGAELDDEGGKADSIADVEAAEAAIPSDDPSAEDEDGDVRITAGQFESEARLLDERIGSRTPISFRDTWSQIHDLQERVRSAPALSPDDVAGLQSDLRAIAVALRERQKSARKQANAVRSSLRESIDLAREAVDAAQSIADLHETRADLLLIKERLTKDGHVLDRATRQVLWQSLQAVNQKAWDGLTAAWEDNRRALEEMLQQAAARLEARDARAAREQIKVFHTTLGEVECNRRAQHELQAAARRLWQQSTELAQEKRAAYLVHAARRVEDWKRALRRQDATRRELEADVRTLEQQASTASTDVAAALVRGQLNERRKALRDLENSSEQLRKHIGDAQPRPQRTDADLDTSAQRPAGTE